MKKYSLIVCLLMSVFSAFAGIKKEKNIAYADKGEANLLDVYYKKSIQNPKDVIIFIHGGSWNSGSKNTYWFLGNNFARKNKVVVIINYPLSPAATYQEMALDCAKAVIWVKQNIAKYGGNPNKIFVMGHSAGAHLVALINQDSQYFNKIGADNPIKGVILDDPFGLDIHQYIKTQINTGDKYIPSFLQTFSTVEENWKKASPINYTSAIKNPYLIFVGSKTYPSIKLQAPAFADDLKAKQKQVDIKEIKGKKHVGMITQMFFGCNILYDDILHFMDKIS